MTKGFYVTCLWSISQQVRWTFEIQLQISSRVLRLFYQHPHWYQVRRAWLGFFINLNQHFSSNVEFVNWYGDVSCQIKLSFLSHWYQVVMLCVIWRSARPGWEPRTFYFHCVALYHSATCFICESDREPSVLQNIYRLIVSVPIKWLERSHDG